MTYQTATMLVHQNQRSGNAAIRRVGQGEGANSLSINGEVRIIELWQQHGKVLLCHVVVVELAQLTVEELHSIDMSLGARPPIFLYSGISKALESRGALK